MPQRDWPTLDPPPPVVFLDVDGTLLPATTSFLYSRHLCDAGLLPRRVLAQAVWHALAHRAGRLDYARLLDRAVAQLRHVPLVQLERLAYECFVARVRPALFPGIIEHVQALRAGGSAVVLASSSPGFVLQPLALFLQVDDLLTTPLRLDRGHLAGPGEGPLCYGAGKLAHAARWAASRGIEMDASAAYSDNWSDVPLLEAVGRAVVVRPAGRLRRHARRRGWVVLDPR